MDDNRRFWIAPNFGWLGRSPALRLLSLPEWMQPYWAWAYSWSKGWCTTFGDSLLFAAATFLLQSTLNSTWCLDLKFSNVLCHFSYFENEAPASILAAILTTYVPFAGEMEAWFVGSTDCWLIISLSITHINVPVNGHCVKLLSKEWLINIKYNDNGSLFSLDDASSQGFLTLHTSIYRLSLVKIKRALYFSVREESIIYGTTP